MGKGSVKEDKNIYQLAREAAGLTRDKAAELMFTTSSRIFNIEMGKTEPTPDDIVAMAECYKDAALCNYYCANCCAIGQQTVPEIRVSNLAQITLGLLSSVNRLEKEKDRLVEISEDGLVSAEEVKDFKEIEGNLDKISLAIDSLKLWIKQQELE